MRKIALLFLLLSLISCGVFIIPTNTKNSFIYRYDIINSGIDSIINITGVYYKSTLNSTNQITLESIDTLGHVFFFFKDGFFLKDACVNCLQATVNNKRFKEYKGGGDWGLYEITGDTIKVQFIEPPGGMSWEKGEIWFKIINKNFIQLLCFKYRDKITQEDVKIYLQNNKNEEISVYQYFPLEILPNPNKCWLKEEKWFWCDQSKYEQWKKEQKAKVLKSSRK